MRDSCGSVCQSISVLPFPMDFSSFPFYSFSEVHVYRCGQIEFMCVNSREDFPPGSWAESPRAVVGNRGGGGRAFLGWGEGLWLLTAPSAALGSCEEKLWHQRLDLCNHCHASLLLRFCPGTHLGLCALCSVPWLECLSAVPWRLGTIILESEVALQGRDEPQAAWGLPFAFGSCSGMFFVEAFLLWWCLVWCSSWYISPNPMEDNGFPWTSVVILSTVNGGVKYMDMREFCSSVCDTEAHEARADPCPSPTSCSISWNSWLQLKFFWKEGDFA